MWYAKPKTQSNVQPYSQKPCKITNKTLKITNLARDMNKHGGNTILQGKKLITVPCVLQGLCWRKKWHLNPIDIVLTPTDSWFVVVSISRSKAAVLFLQAGEWHRLTPKQALPACKPSFFSLSSFLEGHKFIIICHSLHCDAQNKQARGFVSNPQNCFWEKKRKKTKTMGRELRLWSSRVFKKIINKWTEPGRHLVRSGPCHSPCIKTLSKGECAAWECRQSTGLWNFAILLELYNRKGIVLHVSGSQHDPMCQKLGNWHKDAQGAWRMAVGYLCVLPDLPLLFMTPRILQ